MQSLMGIDYNQYYYCCYYYLCNYKNYVGIMFINY